MGLLERYSKRASFRRGIVYLLTWCMFFNTSLPAAFAGPEGAQVVNGEVSFQQSGSNTTITASDKSIINYSSFDIAQPEVVQFIQPGSDASVLNRILSANPTSIYGTLLANGRVFFVNPAGVYIGSGARINVNQLVASSLNMSDSDFINGRYNFVGGDGSVINNGDISAESVYLIGKQVVNSGNISCPTGYVVMAAGDRVFLGEPGSDVVVEIDPPVSSEPVDPVDAAPAVLNEGTVEASGGMIVLAAAGDIYSQAISNVGTLSASVDAGQAGEVKLVADGQISNAGMIDATGDTGGAITIDGGDVILGADSVIHADSAGAGDGGEVLIYGDTLDLDGVVTAEGTEGHVLFDPDILDIDQAAADAIEVSLESTATVDVGANITINLNGEIDSSVQSNDHTLNFRDDNTDDNLTINLNNKITLGADQKLTGDGTVVNVATTGSVQNGIDVAADGGATVNVAAGTYTEDLTITKSSLNLAGASDGDPAQTVIQGISKQTGFPDATSSTNVDIQADDVEVHGFKFLSPLADASIQEYSSGVVLKGTDIDIHHNIFEIQQDVSGGSGLFNGDTSVAIQTYSGEVIANQPVDISGLHIHDNTFTGTPVNGYYGVYINPQSETVDIGNPVIIEDNTFEGSIWRAITTERSYTNILNNTIRTSTANNAGNNSGIRVVRWGVNPVTNVTIAGNEITGTEADKGFAFGIGLGVAGDSLTDVSVTQNTVSGDHVLGVQVNAALSNVTISENSFTGGTTAAFENTTGATVDAAANWWGDATGPTHASNPSGTGGVVTGDVDFSPWLGIGDDAEPGIPGFQAVSPMTWSMIPSTAAIDFAEWIGFASADDTLEFEYAGDATMPAIDDGGKGVNLNITSTGVLTVGNKITVDGSVTLGGVGPDSSTGVVVDDAIDPTTIHLFSNDDIAINEAIQADDWVLVEAGLDGTGSISLDDLTGADRVNITAGAGGVTLSATGGDITVAETSNKDAEIDTSGPVSLTAAAIGDATHPLSVTGTAALNITDTGAGSIQVEELGGTTIASTAITVGNTGYGTIDIAYDNGDQVQIGDNHALTDVDLDQGQSDFSYTATAGDITVGALNTGTKDVTLTASAGAIRDAADDTGAPVVDITAGTIDLTAATGGIGTPAVGPVDGVLEVTATTELNADTDAGDDGDIMVDSIGNLPIGLVDAGTGTVALSASGAISESGGDPEPDIVGGTLSLMADTGIAGASPIETAATNITASTDQGDIDIDNASASATTASLSVDSGAGNILFSQAGGGDLEVVLASTANGNIDIDATANVTLGSLTALGNQITIVSDGAIDDAQDDAITDLAADILDLTANDGIGAGIGLDKGSLSDPIETEAAVIIARTIDLAESTADIVIDNHSVDSTSLTASAVGTDSYIYFSQTGGGELTLSDVSTADGEMQFSAEQGNIVAQLVSVGGDYDVRLTTTTSGDVIVDDVAAVGNTIAIDSAGAISESGGDPDVDLTAATLDLHAASGIGATDAIETDVATLAADSTTGDIAIVEKDDVALKDILAHAGSIFLEATDGGMTYDSGTIKAGASTLTLKQNDDLDSALFVFDNQVNTDLVLWSTGGSVTADNTNPANAADKWNSVTATGQGDVSLQGAGDITTQALHSASGNVEVRSTTGDLIVNDAVTADDGGVSLIADSGKIFTGAGDALNVPISGYSDGTKGVPLPTSLIPGAGGSGKAAIVILSGESLELGTGAELSADGIYDPANDDRSAVGFEFNPLGGEDDPIDVAIYLGSLDTAPVMNVDIRSRVASIGDNGAMVIDGHEAVTFQGPGSLFETSTAFDMTNWLEVVSRVSKTREEAANPGGTPQPRLPYAENPDAISVTAGGWFFGTYVLRGDKPLAKVLGLVEPVPLVTPKPFEPEIRSEAQAPDEGELMAWLAAEFNEPDIQAYLAAAYAPSLSTDLRPYKAAEQLRDFSRVLKSDVDIAALRAVVAEAWPADQPLDEAAAAAIAQNLRARGGEGALYALAGQWIDALTEYVSILHTDIGWSTDKSITFVVRKYGTRLEEGGDVRTSMFVQMHLERTFGT